MHDGTTPLILAARLAVEGMLEDLINSHADVNAVDDLGKLAAAQCVRDGRVARICPKPLSASLSQASPPCTGLLP